MMLPWLLKHEGYPPAVVVAVLLHAFLLYLIFEREMNPDDFIRIEPPAMVIATTVQENPQRLKRLENLESQRQQQQRAEQQRRREQQRVQEEQRVAREKAQQEEAERQRVTQQREREQAEQDRREQEQQQQEALAERQRQEQLEREQIAKEQAAREAAEREAAAAAAATAQAQALTEEQQLVAQYSELMKRAISRQWSRPPSAKNGMIAVLEIRVVPTGEVISSVVKESSGDLAYDRSIQQALERVDSFPELQEVPTDIFNRYFRTVTIGFRSEDLLR
jgi:colicin import membrane protein